MTIAISFNVYSRDEPVGERTAGQELLVDTLQLIVTIGSIHQQANELRIAANEPPLG